MRPSFWRLAAVMVLATVMVLAWAVPAMAGVSGAIWTTDAGGTVNQNFYEHKGDVYLNGGPTKQTDTGLTAGDYYIKVTSPDGVVLGMSVTPIVHVGADGQFDHVVHLFSELWSASSGYTVHGFDDTTNNGGEYKVWVSTSPDFTGGTTKTDNFKVANPSLLKNWHVFVPNDLWLNPDLDLTIRAWYTQDGPLVVDRDWDFVDLVADPGGFYTATTAFDSEVNLWYYFDVGVWDGDTLVTGIETPEAGPENLTYPGPYLNRLDLSLKRWDFTPPEAVIEDGIPVIEAQYQVDGSGDWISVPLTDPDADGTYSALTLFVDATHIHYRFYVDSDVYEYTSAVAQEDITGVVTNVNAFDLSLKHWVFTPPEDLTGITEIEAQWSLDGDVWHDIALTDPEPDGTYEAYQFFVAGTEIYYRFHVVNADWNYTSPEYGLEEITGAATKENTFDLSLKSWEFTLPEQLAGMEGIEVSAYYTTDDPPTESTEWVEIPLADGDEPDGVFTAQTLLVADTDIYYYFELGGTAGYEWTTEVEGPEEITGAETITNEFALGLKTFAFTVPEEVADSVTTIKAQWTTDDPESDDPEPEWHDVALADDEPDGIYTGEVLFIEGTDIYTRFVLDGAYDYVSEPDGPEDITGKVDNTFALGLKTFAITVPAEFAGADVTVEAQWTTDDPEQVAEPEWNDVALADVEPDGVWTGEVLFIEGTDIYTRFVVSGDYEFISEPSAVEDITGTVHNTLEISLKRWEYTPPDELVTDGIDTIVGEYSTDDWATHADVLLVDDDDPADGVYTANTIFVDPTDLEWRVYIKTTNYEYTSEPQAETITGQGTDANVNEFLLSLKEWQFTIPEDLRDVEGIMFQASWTTDDPEDPDSVWHNVTLFDDDEDGVYTAKTLFVSATTIYYRWQIGGGGYAFYSLVEGPEDITGTTTIKNDFAVALKRWIINPPDVLLGLDGITYKAYYTLTDPAGPDTPTWTQVPLTYQAGPPEIYTAETILPDPTTLWYYFEVIGETGGTQFYYMKSDTGSETVTGTTTVENSITLTSGTKTWRLIDTRMLEGVTWYAAWSVDGVEWFEEPLVEDALQPGLWTGATQIPDGMSFYWKFYGKVGMTTFWTSSVGGPETMVSGGLTNELTYYYGQPRTIGYWQNWMNHFSATQMDAIVAEVNSDAHGFSIVFKSGAPDDQGQYTLAAGTKKKSASNTAVAYYLGEAQNAKQMFQMLRAQLLGVELNVAVAQVHEEPLRGEIVGLMPSAPVYLYKVPGYDNALLNPWYPDDVVTVGEVITVIEAAQGGNDWAGWTREMQAFAKNVCDAINNAEGGTGILAP